MRYELNQHGPDDSSTYAECWGANARRGPIKAEAGSLVGLIEAAGQFDHENWSVYDRHRRETIEPRDFWARPVVRRAIPNPE